MSDLDLTRTKTLGDLIRDARVRSSRSVSDCAQVLGMSAQDFSDAESGEYILSLPDLEVLAMYLNMPMSYFWGSTVQEQEQQTDYGDYVMLRQRIIGALLQRARIQAQHSVQDLANEIGVGAEHIEAYEAGSEAIPYFDLERLAMRLGLSLDYFTDDKYGPLARHEGNLLMRKRFDELPPEVKAFVAEPINLSYLETAMRLSALDVDQLRNIAEGILDITF